MDSIEAKRFGVFPYSTRRERSGCLYTEHFYDALEPFGVMPVTMEVEDRWLAENKERVQGIHLQWLEHLWGDSATPSWRRLKQILGLWRFLRLARKYGLLRIVTAHNHEPHEGSDWVHRLGFKMVARNADLIICHSRCAARLFAEDYRPRGQLMVMYIGNYDGVFPAAVSSQDTFAKLGLNPELPMVCCLGLLRDYKGLDLAFEGVRRLRGKVQLVVGGLPHPGFDVEALRKLAQRTPGSVIVDRELNSQEYSDVAAASEAVLLPYRRITGSAALLAAWSLGRGVVTSDLPFFREMIENHPEAGTLFSTGNPESLAQKLMEYVRIPSERRERAALGRAQDLSWAKCIQPVADFIGKWLYSCHANVAS
jgi:beta-1,4-mannosyltransferase